MRTVIHRSAALAAAIVIFAPFTLLAQEAAAEAKPGLLSPNGGLMAWTLAIFLGLMIILSRYAFGPLTRAVEAREKSLQDAIDAAKRDRDEAAKLLAEQRAGLETARSEAQKIIVEGRVTGEKLRANMLEQTQREQHELLDRARMEIGRERDVAIAQLRREAVDLALRGASRVIEKNLDDQTNRALVEKFLASLSAEGAKG